MFFKQIVVLDYTGLQGFALQRLQELSENPVAIYNDVPADEATTIERARDAEALFVSWNTPVSAKVLAQCHKLKYIGMCCSLIDEDSANVDVRYARANGIEVTGIRDYGDEGVAEFIIAELIGLLKGLGKHQWRSEPLELGGRRVGIVGMGTTGLLTARHLQFFGAKVSYYSRSRKPDVEQLKIDYQPLEELLQNNDIISFHLPRNAKVLSEEHFQWLGNRKIIVNTSLGLPFEKEVFEKWLLRNGNYAIFDHCGFGPHMNTLTRYNNIIYSDKTSGWTREAKGRLSDKVLDNLNAYLANIT
ncbi:hypothetical protein KEM09_20500 [Carboxylicivirga mesophila]|uniref:Dihydrofolate reductase n=1 Tax=Carboxylicivirga mesophila TaxID=1166478 RepID=A0ABS5KFN2_9BACT|nr:NAD(P)-dependent oxidoreductase [Carboxylicivirga mesophila]MBS2213800.1 hypothetical protein [Carboxylicivirga mesophila]